MKYALSIKQSLLFTDLSLLGCEKKYFKIALSIDYSFPECLIRGDDIFWNYDNDIPFDKAILSLGSLNKAVKHFNISLEKITENLEKVTNRIVQSKKLNSKDKRELASLFKEYVAAYALNMPFLFHFWNIENLLINKLKEDFVSIYGRDDGDNKLQQVFIPSKETYFAKERKSLEEIAVYILKTPRLNIMFQKENGEDLLNEFPRLKSILEKHINNFAFTSFTFLLGNPQDIHSVIERLQELLKENILEKINEQNKQILEDKKKTHKILKKLSSDTDIYERVLLAQELMFWKNQRLDILFKSDLKIKPLFDEIAKLMGLSYKEFVYLRYEEIEMWFEKGNLLTKQEIKKRMENFALYLSNGKIFLFTDKNKYPKVQEDSKKGTPPTDNEILEGKTAYKGKVIGRVRLIYSTEDIKSLEKGEILVTKMTRPEMVVGLERAAAFVTDQGGMLSHAAIVAREMKKPCIVGTEIATQIFRNGDLIEVDANKGIVRKLG